MTKRCVNMNVPSRDVYFPSYNQPLSSPMISLLLHSQLCVLKVHVVVRHASGTLALAKLTQNETGILYIG